MSEGQPETVSVFEATTGGLVNAALQSVPGASRYYHGGANIYGKQGYSLYPPELRAQLAQGPGRSGNSARDGSQSSYRSAQAYRESKVRHTCTVSKFMNSYMGSTWCIAESGATGPTFAPPDCQTGFTAIAVAGPSGQSTVVLVQSEHANREANMWSFAAAALAALEEAIRACPVPTRRSNI